MTHAITIVCPACHTSNEPIVRCSQCHAALVDVASALADACRDRDAVRAEVVRLQAGLRRIRARSLEMGDDYRTGVRHMQESDADGKLREVDARCTVGGPIGVCLIWTNAVNEILGADEIALSNEEYRISAAHRALGDHEDVEDIP